MVYSKPTNTFAGEVRLFLRCLRKGMTRMNTGEMIYRLLTALGTDKEKLQQALLCRDAEKRGDKSAAVLAAAFVWMVLVLVSGAYWLSVLTVIPAVMLWHIWKPYLQARKYDVTDNLMLYLNTAAPEVRTQPLYVTIKALTDSGSKAADKLQQSQRSAKVFAMLSIVVMAANLGCAAFMGMNNDKPIAAHHVAYTAAPTATPAPAYLAENGEVTLYNWQGDVVDGVLTLPSEVDGMPVTAIGKLAFADRDDFTCVVVPEGVKTIASGAFRSCSYLQKAVLPQSLTTLGAEAFKMCLRLEECVVPAGVTELNAETFAFCSALKQVTLPEGLVKISANCFDNCYGLQQVTLPDTLTTISAYAFRNCSRLSSIVIPERVNAIGAYAFSGCSGLQSVTMPSTMPNGKISERTFEECTALTSIVVPHGVLKISERAFYNCTSLEDVQLPSTLLEIGSSAFRSCQKLRRIEVPKGCDVDERAFKDSPAKVIRK